MSKGRYVPPKLPPFKQVTRTNPSLEELTAAMQPGLHILSYAHDSWCKAGQTQRMQDCTCDPDVTLLRYVDDGGVK